MTYTGQISGVSIRLTSDGPAGIVKVGKARLTLPGGKTVKVGTQRMTAGGEHITKALSLFSKWAKVDATDESAIQAITEVPAPAKSNRGRPAKNAK